jgi:SNF2 family DNA or RNA helicase
MTFWYDASRELMVYPLSAAAPLHVLSDAVRLNGSHFAVPRTLINSQILRFYNFPVVPPINDKNYDWPIEPGRKPLAHQKIMANFCVLHPRCFNLSDMGTMKTQSTIWAADWLMRQSPGFKALIICPLSIMESIWANSIFRSFLDRRKFQVLHGTEKSRITGLAKDADFYIVNPDGISVGAEIVHRRGVQLGGFAKALADRKDIRLVVVDEASCYKDGTTNRHRIARQVIRRDYLWLLTGTPTPNAPTDAYGLAYMVNNAFGKAFTRFREETMYRATQYKWVPRRDGYDQARALLTPAIRFDIKDVWDGPEETTQQVCPELTVPQQKYMKELKDELTIELGGKPVDAINEASFRNKFLQISAGAVYDRDHIAHYIDSVPRLKVLQEVIEHSGGKVVVFAGLTSIVDLLYQKFYKLLPCEIVNGHTPHKKRTQIFHAFQNEDAPKVLFADPGTMAHGIELFQARCVVWYTPTDKNEHYTQGNKRVHRPGQTHPVTIVQIASNKLEKEIFKRLETQTSLQGALLDMVRKGDF